MKYYLHDSNAFNDEKITELYKNYGYEGLGLFWTLLEKIAGQEKPIKTDVLKFQLKVGKKLEKCWNFMESIGLICSNNSETFNEQLLNFSEKYTIKKEKTKNKVAQWRENQNNKKNVTSYNGECNDPKVKLSKVKLSKVNKEKKIFTPPEFFEVENYFIENGFEKKIAKKAFDYYNNFNWTDSKGNKIKNWKQKMFAVWFKDENKIKNTDGRKNFI